jgi:hypothetical protein
MRASLKTCSWRSAVAVLASGAVVSLSALSGGVAPALAKPDKNDPGIPIVPTPEVVIPEAPQQAPAPQIQAPAPEPAPKQQEAPAPQVVAPAPKKEQPRVVEAPKADAPKVDAPKVEAPPVEAPKANAPKVDAPPVEAPAVDAPKVDAPKVDAPNADATLPLPAADEPGKSGVPKQDVQVPGSLAPGETPKGDEKSPADRQVPAADEPGSDSSSAPKAAQRAALAAPETLKAPEEDIQLAKKATPIEVKPEPARKEDVDFLSSALNVQSKTKLGPFESDFRAGSDFSVGRDRDRGRDWDNRLWDKRVRQWDRNWIEYDRFYRPVIFNPFRAPVRIVYGLANATRILVIQPLARVVVDVAEVAAYSFTAVVLGAANVAADLAYTAADVVNVAVGTFFGGGYVPRPGLPFVPPPPLLRYDNVPVQVRYSNATYQPFRVNQIVDLGDDVQYGGRKVLLDGATPAWGQWVTSPAGERQFEVHRTQQYPGLGEPQEAPLPGDYRMQLASDESAAFDRTQMYLIAAGGVVGGLGLSALGLAFYLGRRRLQV